MLEKKGSVLDIQWREGWEAFREQKARWQQGGGNGQALTPQIVSLALILSAVASTSESAGAELHGFKDPLQHDDGGGAEAGDHLRVQGQGADRRGLRELRRRD